MSVTSYNPADPTDLVVEAATPGAFGTEAAVERARAAQGGWLAAGAAARSAALGRAAAAVEAHADELAALAVREVGKPIAEARGEVARTAAILRYYAQAPYAAAGAVHEPAAGPGLLLTRRRPYGVAGLITPWNFPLAIPVWKAAPALATGNTVVLKPAPEATACALRLAELLGLPEGVFTVVPGGAEEGGALVSAADVVSFTGSTATGTAVIAAATSRGIPVQAELGGLNSALVLPDADIEQAAAHLAAAIAGYAGQKCTATSKVIAVGAAYQPLREALAKALAATPPGDPANPATVCGPVVSEAALTRLTAAVDSARAAGATVLAGGERPALAGWFIEPTLLTEVPEQHPLLAEEFFGPVAVLLAAADLDEAIALANGTRHTLATSVHTRSLDTALAVADRLDAGMIRVNAPSSGVDFHLPFGGAKGASYGEREQGQAALDFYTASRTVTLLPAGDPQ
ncbi:acyl-CoA reductase-like NAD-dependent aldehyde dehydrogenase [Kitasatospora sp. MAP12-15]|uniref:aldehyde dehydrogenase family protein n=1 Tax=unclassified Kitasatospora TaxID=2633591 RepID=UPI0024753D30|nr:aldehyde dehydrogenase family protein [Kitasatospora sp. MAP12-44]MDH6109553.1 acyl-CoA reductase-like NAD-dependent aldehyde dehydrogenase [Kitasatospora sp. MAP12-44]